MQLCLKPYYQWWPCHLCMTDKYTESYVLFSHLIHTAVLHHRLLLLLKTVEFDDDVALLLSAAGPVVGPHVTSESEIGGTDSTALRTSRTCLRLCGSCATGCTSFFRPMHFNLTKMQDQKMKRICRAMWVFATF